MSLPVRPVPIPPRVVGISILALLAAVAASTYFRLYTDVHPHLVWLLALVPAFLLAHHRGWRGAAIALAGGMAALAFAELLTPGPAVDARPALFLIILVFLAASLGAGWLSEAARRRWLLWERQDFECSVVTDDEAIIRHVTPATERLLGTGRDRIVGSPLWAWLSPESAERVRDAFDEVVDVEGQGRQLDVVLTPEGSPAATLHMSLKNLTADPAIGGILVHCVDISELRWAHEELEEVRRRMDELGRALPDGLLLVVEGRVSFASAQALELLGLELSEAVGLTPGELFAAADARDVDRHFARVEAGDEIGSERFATRADPKPEAAPAVSADDPAPPGAARAHRLPPAAPRDPRVPDPERERRHPPSAPGPPRIELHSRATTFSGRPGVVSVLRDVSREESYLASVHDLLEWQGHILEGSRDAIFISDAEGRFRQVNDAATELTGYSRGELLGMSIPDLHEEVDLHAYRAFHRRIMQGLEAITEADVRRKDGRKVPVEFNNRRIEVGGQLFMHTVGRDISERRAQEEERRRLSTAINQSAELVMILDPDGTIEYVNPAFERITGYAAAEAEGRPVSFLRSDRHPPAFFEELWDTIRAGKVWSGRLVNRRKDGSLYHQDTTVSPVRSEAGQIVNFVALGRDVTELTRLEESLRQAQKMEAVGRLTGGLAHDFNNLLSVVLSNTQVVRQLLTSGVDEEINGCLEDIESTAREGAEMVARLMAFSRKEALRFEVVQLPDVVDRFRRTLGRLLPEHIETRIEVDPKMPPVRADAAAVKQMLLNLVSNARDAMPAGGELVIRVGTGTLTERDQAHFPWVVPGPHALVEVRDSGPGVSPEVQPQIFEPFFTTKGLGKGTGLGLAMVYGLAKQHGGAATVESRPGEGATFRIFLPKATAAQVAEAEDSAEGDRRSGRDRRADAPLTPRRILLVEDEDTLRRALQRVLERLGHEVLLASNGVEALDVLEEGAGDVDLVISDLVMPSMGGMELLGEVRTRFPGTPVLLTSGYENDEARAGSPDTEDVPFLRKPWSIEELSEVLERVFPS